MNFEQNGSCDQNTQILQSLYYFISPLVEEVLGEMLESDDSQEPISNATGVNGDNFMKTVMKMNKHISLGSFFVVLYFISYRVTFIFQNIR